MKKYLILLLVFCLLACPVIGSGEETAATDVITATNLLKNGGFEDKDENGIPVNWIKMNDFTFEVQSEEYYSGSSAVLVGGRTNAQTEIYYQAVSLEAGKTYILSGMVKLKNAEDEGAMFHGYATNTTSGDSPWSSQESIKASAGEWRRLTKTYVPQNDVTANVNIICWDASVEYFLDDLYFGEVAVSDVAINGRTLLKAPENGTSTLRLRTTALNQFGGKEGLYESQNMDNWTVTEHTGVSVDEYGTVSADYRSAAGTVTVTGTKAKGYPAGEVLTQTYTVEIIPGDTSLYEGNLFADGGFEEFKNADWGEHAIILSEQAAEGHFSACLPAGGSVGQRVHLKPNTEYFLSAQVKADSAENSFQFTTNRSEVIISGESVAVQDGNWHRIVAILSTEALSEDTEILVSLSDNAGKRYYADSFFLAEMRLEFDACDVQVSFLQDGAEIQHLQSGEVDITAVIENGLGDKNITLYSALYEITDNGERLLQALPPVNARIAAGEQAELTPEQTMKVTNPEKQIIKAFIWDMDLRPQCIAELLASSDAIELFVAQNGNDENPGTSELPFATLKAARDKIRNIKTESGYPEDGITVWIRDGVYEQTETLSLYYPDSGTEQAPVRYRAWPGEEVVFCGGISLEADAFVPVSDQTILNRVIDETARQNLVQIDLGKQGLNEDVELYLPGSFPLPWVSQNTPMPELVIDDEVMTLARYPNEGYMSVGTVVDPGAYPVMWNDSKKDDPEYVPEEERDQEDAFVIAPTDERFLQWTNAPMETTLLYGFWRWTWADQTVPLKAIDTTQKTIESAHPSYYSVTEDGYFYAFNLLEEIDRPGEYYADYDQGILYLYSEMESVGTNIYLSTMKDPMVQPNMARDIRFEGITFTASRGTAVAMHESHNIVLENCTFSNLAGKAVTMDYYSGNSCEGCGLLSCHIKNTNGGVQLYGGVAGTLTPGRNFVENCHFENFSRLKQTYNGAVTLYGVGNIVRGNEIHNAPNLAIQLSGNDHLIEYNNIYDVLQNVDDMGAVYMGRSWTARGNKIRYNYIHDINSVGDKDGDDYAIFGIYLDDCFSSADIMGNVVADLEGGYAFCINGGRDNHIEGNVVVNTYGHLSATTIGVSQNMDVHYAGLEAVPYQSDLWKSAYPELYSILDNEPLKPIDNTYTNNLLINAGYLRLWGEVEELLYQNNNVVQDTDPGFANMAEKNYLLEEDSPVFATIPGFKQLPVRQMGNTTQ